MSAKFDQNTALLVAHKLAEEITDNNDPFHLYLGHVNFVMNILNKVITNETGIEEYEKAFWKGIDNTGL